MPWISNDFRSSILDTLKVLSRKFCSAENFGPGPIFSGKIVPPGSIFSEKNGPVLKIIFRFTFSIVMNLYINQKFVSSLNQWCAQPQSIPTFSF